MEKTETRIADALHCGALTRGIGGYAQIYEKRSDFKNSYHEKHGIPLMFCHKSVLISVFDV
jgi:hypothetical protein